MFAKYNNIVYNCTVDGLIVWLNAIIPVFIFFTFHHKGTMKNFKNDTGKLVVNVILATALLFCIYTYYTALNQYATADQNSALSRTETFLSNPDSVKLFEGYGFTYIVVGLPGNALKKYLDKNFQKNGHIVGNIYNTERLAFMFFQVTEVLILLFYVTFLLFKLTNLQLKGDLAYYLLMLLIIINYPMLKGVTKVFKQDSLMIMTSLASILNYIFYRKTLNFKYLVYSGAFIALAFIQKNSSFSVILLILALEMCFLVFKPGKNLIILKEMIFFLVVYLSVFIFTCYIFLPKIWFNPSEFLSITGEIDVYAQGFTNSFILTSVAISLVAFVIIRYFVNRKNDLAVALKKNSKTKVKPNIPSGDTSSLFPLSGPSIIKICYILFAIGLILLVAAIVYQKNNIISLITADEETLQKIRMARYFVSPKVFGWSFSTMDKSPYVTIFKMFFNHIRIFIYTSPIVSVFLLFVSFLLIALGIKEKKFDGVFIPIIILLGFALASLFAYSLLYTLPEAKYNLLPNMLLVMAGIFIAVKYIHSWTNNYLKYAVIFLLVAGISKPVLAGNPTYLGYMNDLRDKTYENNDFLDYNKYCFWTWAGWGESSYSCYQYIEKNYPGTQKVMFSYMEPFHVAANITSVEHPSFDHRNPFNNGQLRSFLQYLVDSNFTFLIVNKNRACRDAMANYVVRNYRDNAVFVEKINGFEYAWMYEVKPLLKLAGGPSAEYYINKSSQKFGEKKYEEVIELCKMAQQSDSGNVNIYINLAAAYVNLNRMEEAFAAAKKSVELDPSSTVAKNNLNYIQYQLSARKR
jgi:hypothetical protein